MAIERRCLTQDKSHTKFHIISYNIIDSYQIIMTTIVICSVNRLGYGQISNKDRLLEGCFY